MEHGGAHQRIPLLVIAGPTATGKTEAAIAVCEAHGGEIVSADSMQIYREMDIGTAKPTAQERARVPFHLVDCVDPRANYTVADFQRDAVAAIADIHRRGRLPVLCGGTGLYIRAVLGGLDFPPGASEEAQSVRRRLALWAEQQGPKYMHQKLAEVDPQSAARLPEGDLRRVLRALEVHELTGKPFSQAARVDDSAVLNYNAKTFIISCPRLLLYERIEQRVDAMLEQGWVEEVRALHRQGLTRNHQSMQAIGYRHILEYLEQGGDVSATVETIKRDTRRFAKRQLTWFRRESGRWLEWSETFDLSMIVSSINKAATALGEGEISDVR